MDLPILSVAVRNLGLLVDDSVCAQLRTNTSRVAPTASRDGLHHGIVLVVDVVLGPMARLGATGSAQALIWQRRRRGSSVGYVVPSFECCDHWIEAESSEVRKVEF